MSEQKIENPYQKECGHALFETYIANGFGITIETIQSWLFDHHLNPEMTKYLNLRNAKDSSSVDIEADVNRYLSDNINTPLISYWAGSENGYDENSPATLAYLDKDPEDETHAIVPSTSECLNALRNAINVLYDIPNDKNIQAELQSFVDMYANYVSLVQWL